MRSGRRTFSTGVDGKMSMGQTAKVGRVDDFPVGQLKIVAVGRREIGVVRRADGTVQAVRNWCPHKGAPICKGPLTGTMLPVAPGELVWAREGEILRCPWHGFEFEMATGARPYLESRMRLRVYPARIERGEIIVDMSPQRSSAASETNSEEDSP